MALKIRLRRMGRRNAPTYRIVVAESSMPRDGRFVTSIGHYNPRTDPMTLVVDREKALEWLGKGAVPTETAKALMKRAGVFRPVDQSVVATVVETVKTTAKKAAGAAKGAAKGAASKASGAAKGAASGVKGAVAAAAEEVQEKATAVVEAVKGGDDGDEQPGGEAVEAAAPAETSAAAEPAPEVTAAAEETAPAAAAEVVDAPAEEEQKA
jgi:small subunit ribosomal protein S16